MWSNQAVKPAAGVAVFLAMLAVCCGILGSQIRKYSLEGPEFVVRKVGLKGGSPLSNRDILSSAGIEPGASVFSIDPHAASLKIERNPFVKRARVSIKPPWGVEIQVEERHGCAYLFADRYYPISEDMVILPGKKSFPSYEMPVIDMPRLRRTVFRDGEYCVDETVRRALDLIREYRGNETSGRLKLLKVSPYSGFGKSLKCLFEGELEVMTEGEGWKDELDTLLEVLDGHGRDSRRLKYVDFTRVGSDAPVVAYR